MVIKTTGLFEECRVCSFYSGLGCDDGCLTLRLTGFEGGLERRSAPNLLSRGPFGDNPFGLYFIFAFRISSAGDELPRLGKWS